MKYAFIINPASGKAETKVGLEEKIANGAASAGVTAEIFKTEKPGDVQRYISELSEKYAGEELRVYVCGGDGTVCEAVNGIMALSERSGISLGVVPVGTGNDFVRNFGGKERFLDIETQIKGECIDVDLLRCNELYCVNMINIGFDCQVVVKTAKIKKRKYIPSKLAYIFGLVITLIKKPGTKFKIVKDAKSEQKQLLLCTFANGSYCGGGFHSNPEADICDGNINALFVDDISRIKFISIVGKYKSGTHLDGSCDDIVVSEKAREYRLEFDAPTEISVDGEIVTVDRADIYCLAGAIRVIMPK